MDLTMPDWLTQSGPALKKLLLVVILVVWCLWAVDWRRAWPVLAAGGWAPLTLIGLMAAAVWALVWPTGVIVLWLFPVPNGLWQLGAVSLLIGVALFCGWVQTHYGRPPAEINLEPPAAGPAHTDHGLSHH